MYCTRCGRKIDDGDAFCPSCGSPVSGDDFEVRPVAEAGGSPTDSLASSAAHMEADAGKIDAPVSGDINRQVRAARRRSRLLMPRALVIALIMMMVSAAAAFAAYLVYEHVYVPYVRAQREAQMEQGFDGDGKGTSKDKGSGDAEDTEKAEDEDEQPQESMDARQPEDSQEPVQQEEQPAQQESEQAQQPQEPQQSQEIQQPVQEERIPNDAFIARARRELRIPDDLDGVTYTCDEEWWEGVGMMTYYVQFSAMGNASLSQTVMRTVA